MRGAIRELEIVVYYKFPMSPPFIRYGRTNHLYAKGMTFAEEQLIQKIIKFITNSTKHASLIKTNHKIMK